MIFKDKFAFCDRMDVDRFQKVWLYNDTAVLTVFSGEYRIDRSEPYLERHSTPCRRKGKAQN